MRMKFCANLAFMFPEVSLLERYALAKEVGFTAVETGFPFGHELEDVISAKNNAGIKQVLINLKTGDVAKGQLGVTAIPGKESEFKENLKTTIQYAKALQCKKIHIMAGIVEKPEKEHWDTYISNLKYAAELLLKEQILGVIEPINNHTVPNYFLHDYKKAVAVINAVGSAHIALMLDMFHMQHICGDISNKLKELMPYIGHVQIAQVPNRNEPDTEGELNYRYILKLLESYGYTGYVGLEYKPLKTTVEGLDWVTKYGYTL